MTTQTNFLDQIDPNPHVHKALPTPGAGKQTGEQLAVVVAKKSQTDHAAKILALLKLRPATSRELAAIALKYTSRISDLRAAGHRIDCRKCVDHETHKTTHIYILMEPE